MDAGDDLEIHRLIGKEQVFAGCGFSGIARPTPKRAVLRREL